MKAIYLLTLLSLIFQTSVRAQEATNTIDSIFNNHNLNGCFVLYDQNNDTTFVYNEKLASKGYLPASTFKIPHALIALEESLVKNINDTIIWNGHEWPHKVWNKDQTLESSLKYSCIWVYFAFAEQLGIDKYYTYINKYNYGNKNLTGPPTRFWLAGEFKITALEQIEFLRKFYNYKLPAQKLNVDQVKNAILLEETSFYRYYGKTGGTDIKDGEHIMWLVGFVETEDNTFIYAMNFVAPNFKDYAKIRYKITLDILKELGIIN